MQFTLLDLDCCHVWFKSGQCDDVEAHKHVPLFSGLGLMTPTVLILQQLHHFLKKKLVPDLPTVHYSPQSTILFVNVK